MNIQYNLENILESYNQKMLNVLWNYKIRIVILLVFAYIGNLYIPYLEDLQKSYEIKSDHNVKYLSLNEIKERKNMFDVILDVRSSEEYNKGHIENSINIDYKDILNEKKISALKDKNIISENIMLVYCKTGKRAQNVIEHLTQVMKYNPSNLYFTNENYVSIQKVWS